MPLRTLDHCSIRTLKLEESREFYEDVLGMDIGPRPNLPFPGFWLYVDGRTVIHLLGIDPADPSGLLEYLGGDIDPQSLDGSGSFDHIAFCATNAPAMIRRLKDRDVPYRERQVPDMDLYQIFVKDPNGITVEINYFETDQ